MKRMVSIVLALFVCVTSMGMFGIFADGDATVQASTVQGTAGNTVEVTLTMTNNPGISFLKLRIGYDKDVMTLTAAEDLGGLGDARFTASENYTYNPYVLTWASAGNFNGNGAIAKLTFEINENAASGSTDVTVECADCNNQALQDVTVATVNGKVEIVSVKPEFTLSDAEGTIGDEIVVNVSINNNPEISYFRLRVGYDADKLKLLEAEETNLFKGMFTFGESIDNNPYVLSWANVNSSNKNGVVITLKFKILDKTTSIGTTDITLEIAEITKTNGPGDIVNITNNFNGKNSVVTINDVDCEHVFDNIEFVDKENHKKICSVCHREYLEAHTWDEGEQTKDPTCTEAGETTYHCAICDGSKEEQFPAALGHDWGEWVVTTEPGCDTKGVETRTCKRDATHTETRDVAALGHDWGEWVVTTEPGCDTKGVETRTCKRDATHTETRDVAALGHDWGEWVVTTEPGCETAGEETRTCKRDASHTETREVAALGHDWGEWVVTKEPDCETAGEETRTCKRDESHKETREVSALGHSFTDYVYNNDATKTKDGTETAECDHGCGTKDTRTKPGTKLPDENPPTGDAGWWIAGIALVSLAGVAAVLYLKKKRIND